MSRVLVTGGNGFIGKEVCRLAAERGHEVVSVSRSGRPGFGDAKSKSNSDSNAEPAWATQVRWVSASVFEPRRWRGYLEGCTGVVHSIGAIDDTPKEGIVLERINGDAAILAGLEAERAGVRSFSFVSASTTPPDAREAYLTAKRRAERELVDLDLSVARLRPGPVYGEDEPNPHFSRVTNRLLRELGERERIARRFGDARPLPLERVAGVALETALDPEQEGLYDVSVIGGARLVPIETEA
jgi:nucleoside-diphosphate-sugar epimerase